MTVMLAGVQVYIPSVYTGDVHREVWKVHSAAQGDKVRDTGRERTGSTHLTFPLRFPLPRCEESSPVDYFYLTEGIIWLQP